MRGIRGAARNAYILIAQAAAHGKEIGFFGT
jgi:hypothetical protein